MGYQKRAWVFMGMLVVMGWLSTGCASTGYGKRGFAGGGYWDKQVDNGIFEVNFLAQRRPFAWVKEAGVYRAAEVTFEKGYLYFQVIRAEDKSYEIRTMGPYGGGTSNYTPVIQIHIQCFNTPPDGEYVDAYKYLDENPIPGTEKVFSVAERGGAPAAQGQEGAAPAGGAAVPAPPAADGGAAVPAPPPADSAAPDPKADQYFQAGVGLYKQGKYEDSIKYYDAAIQLNPNHWQAYQSKGHAYYRLGRKTEALSAYDASLRLNPANTELKSFADKVRAGN